VRRRRRRARDEAVLRGKPGAAADRPVVAAGADQISSAVATGAGEVNLSSSPSSLSGAARSDADVLQ
jgi:hypothetical protein